MTDPVVVAAAAAAAHGIFGEQLLCLWVSVLVGVQRREEGGG